MSFFEASNFTAKPENVSTLAKCGACQLFKSCESPKIGVSGKGRLGILVVGGSPSEEEDLKGEHFAGVAGQLLREVFKKNGLDFDRDCWKTNAIICRPELDRPPTSHEVDYCRPNISKLIQDLQPTVIIPLGSAAVRSVVAPMWKEDVGKLEAWLGWNIPSQRYNAWVCPTYLPASVLEAREEREGAVVRLWFERHIAAAIAHDSRPWDVVPNYKKSITVVYDPAVAAEMIQGATDRGDTVAFDYETNRLKPDHPKAEIVCCSVCWRGKETIAFPWVGDVIPAMRNLLASDCPKIGWNKKFEERWTRRILGINVNNWTWDGMLSAHHLDCREGITSAKFQGLVRLGQEDWSGDIKPYLGSATPDGFNRIREVDLRKLLIYCGIDSLVEFKVATQQRKEMSR